MADEHEVDWGNDEDDPVPSKSLLGSIGMSHAIGGGELDDVEDAVSLGGDEEEEFAAYGARPNGQNTPPTDKSQTTYPKTDVSRRSISAGVTPRKVTGQAQTAPLPPSPQPEINQPTPKLTHALPPKPVVASSFRVPPSTTAASPMSMPRKERRSNGSVVNTGDEPPSTDRETKNSHNVVREGRHHESHPDESSWTRPGSSAADLSSLPRDRTKSFDDRDSRPSSRRGDDRYRPSHRQTRYSSDEEGKESSSHLAQSRNDIRYRHDDRDKRHDYASGDRNNKSTTRTARLSPEDESLDRVRPGYRESNDSDTRRVHSRDRDLSPVRDDSSRRVPRRDDYPVYDSFDKGPRDYDEPSRRGTGTAEQSRHPEAINGRTNSVNSREPYAQNQGPGRSPTLRRNPPSPRPRSRSPLYNRRDDRGHTPPRHQEYPSDSRIPHDRGRAESPPSRSRGSDRLDRHDAPFDPPQRRPRAVSDTRDLDYSVKRRKTEDRDGNPSSVRRGGPVGTDTYIPQETSTASTSPRSTGAMDDFSRPGPRRRGPLPSQSHRYKEASSDQSHRRPVSGSNRVMPPPQPTAPSHRHYPPVPREHDVLQSRHPDQDISRPDRPRGPGHDLVHHYPDKLRRDDHMDVDPPYSSRASRYEEPARPRDLGSRPSSHTDVMINDAISPTSRPKRRDSFNVRPTSPVGSASIITENIRGRSRDRSPRSYREPRQTSGLPSTVSLATMSSGLPRDTQFVEDYHHHERRVDRDREGHSPTLPRNSSNAVAPRSQPSGRYDEPGGMRLQCLYSVCVPITYGFAVPQANVPLYVAVLEVWHPTEFPF
ncbi:hypothetical protein BJY52DRAFT_1255293 [Lactarius psammicola]|nr:hypothetical protein BJY52DRAFT_1255293 [Lactarius psammicola]